MSDIRTFIEAMPKVELHLHIEGSLEPELMFELAQRNKIDIPFGSVEEVREAYNFSNLQDFLDIYYQGMNVLQTEQDFYDLTMAYLEKVAAQNLQHTEIFFDPQGHTERGIAFETVINGITRALDDAQKDKDISSRLIMCFLRHLSEEAAFDTLQEALPYKDRIHGVGLDSSEVGHPPEKFERAFAEARKQGFEENVAHICEEGPPEYGWQGLDKLLIARGDHGNRSLEDSALTARLVQQKMGLTVCPLSNLKLCVVDDMRNHPLKQMLDLGLKATVNSDDPSYFGGYMTENFIAVAEALSLSKDDVLTLARNAIDVSFAEPARKKELHDALDRYAGAQKPKPASSPPKFLL
ncbi:MAG: adenosine deaminase [Rhodospirillales bacterium]|nr:adenosine deaminase [Rhodospirillales bacterium]